MKKYLTGLSAGILVMMTTACGTAQTSTQAEYISMDAARTAALTAANIDAQQAEIQNTLLAEKNGVAYYEVSFAAGDKLYSYDIDAITGVVIDGSGDALEAVKATAAPQESSSGQKAGISLEQAKQIALTAAQLSEDEVTVVKSEQDYEAGRLIYEIEFVKSINGTYAEYDYEIDAATGDIIAQDYDAENYKLPAGNGAATMLTDEAARQTVLSRVPGASAQDIYEFELDLDDGRMLYKGELVYETVKYEFELDAYSGTILEWETETIYNRK